MEIKVKKGVVKLRLPNFIESWRLRSKLGVAPSGGNQNDYVTMKIAENMQEFVDVSGVKDCNDFDEFINDPANSKNVIKIVGKIAERIMQFSGEKKN